MKKIVIFSAILFLLFLNPLLSEKPKILEPDGSLGRTGKVIANKIIVRFKGEVHKIKDASILLKNSSAIISKQLLDPALSIRYGRKKHDEQVLSFNSYSAVFRTEEPLLRTYYIDYEGNIPPEKFCTNLLNSNKNIEIAEPVYIDELLTYIPNDPLVSQQGVLSKIKAFTAWDITKGDTNVIIAISDNGVFQEHEDITKNIATNWKEIPNNGIDDDGNGFPDDFRGANMTFLMDMKNPGDTYNPSESHGTSVAGMAAGSTDNSKGIAGVGFNCRLYPIKVAPYNSTAIYYGYESMLLAAKRGCKVMNCSWGLVKKPSSVDKSIIDYAIANDVAIVAAGGNNAHSTDITFPAGYDGVLGVGEVNSIDNITSSSSIGPQIAIMAQGVGNQAPTNGNGYEQLSTGTSYASPIVAGAVALTRSRYPNLSARQSIELVRQSTDELALGNNQQFQFFVPGRLNLLKAVQNDKISIPSIRPLDIVIKSTDKSPVDRMKANDTVLLEFKAFNYLSEASNLRFALKIYKQDENGLKVVDSIVQIAKAEANAPLIIGDFKIFAESITSDYTFFRVDIYGENDYHDFFTWRITPKTDITTLSNNVISFSVGDRATFGYGMKEFAFPGIGFRYKNFQSQLYKGGLMASESNLKTISALHSTFAFDDNAFSTVKPFYGAQNNVGIFSDSSKFSVNPIGLRIKTEYTFPMPDLPVTRVLINIKNISDQTLKAVSVGYFADWDIGLLTDSNYARLFTEAYPEFFAPVAMAAELAGSVKPGFPCFAIMAFSPDGSNEAQAGAYDYATASDFNEGYQIASLNSGTEFQLDGAKDISMVVGMRFPGDLLPGEERDFVVLIGAGDTPEELAEDIKNILLGTGIENKDKNSAELKIFPNPAKNLLFIEQTSFETAYEVEVFDLSGKRVLAESNKQPEAYYSLNLESLSPGVYFLKVKNSAKSLIRAFVKE